MCRVSVKSFYDNFCMIRRSKKKSKSCWVIFSQFYLFFNTFIEKFTPDSDAELTVHAVLMSKLKFLENKKISFEYLSSLLVYNK